MSGLVFTYSDPDPESHVIPCAVEARVDDAVHDGDEDEEKDDVKQ